MKTAATILNQKALRRISKNQKYLEPGHRLKNQNFCLGLGPVLANHKANLPNAG